MVQRYKNNKQTIIVYVFIYLHRCCICILAFFRMSKRFRSDLLDIENSQSEGEHQILELEIKKPIISANIDSDGG